MGGKYAIGDIALVLLRTRHAQVAALALGRMAARLDGDETKALLGFLKELPDHGGLSPVPADRVKIPRRDLRRKAEIASAKDKASLRAIRALAFLDGNDVVLLLNRLAEDRSESVQGAANDALAIREALGFQLQTAYKKAPVGEAVKKLAFRAEKAEDLGLPAWSGGKGLSELDQLKAALLMDLTRPWRNPLKKPTAEELAAEPKPLKVKPSAYQKKRARDEKIQRRIRQIEKSRLPPGSEDL